MEWLKGNPDLFKKHGWRIDIDGIRYSLQEYDEMFKAASRLKEGDLIFCSYSGHNEPIKEIRREWVQFWPAHYKGEEVFIEEITFVTEDGYIIYDINDAKYCGVTAVGA